MYDTQSNSSAVLAGARKAVGDGVQALISNDVYFDTAAPYLAEEKIPVFGFGITLGLLRPRQADVLLTDGQLDRLPERRRHAVPRRPGAQEDRRAVRPQPGQRQRRPRHRQRRADGRR